MSGKPKQVGGKSTQSSWGGARKGSGKKPLHLLSDTQARRLHAEIKKREKLEGRRWQSILMDFVYGSVAHSGSKIPMEMTARERIAALKLLSEISMAKQSEQSITVTKNDGPTIYLPELRKPGELVTIEGGKEQGATGT